MHPAAWIVWATCAGLVAFTTTDPFYLGLVVAVSWFVYARQRVPGPTQRSFRVFAIAGFVTMVVRTSLVFLGTVDAGSVAFAALEGARLATLLIVFGTFHTVTDRGVPGATQRPSGISPVARRFCSGSHQVH